MLAEAAYRMSWTTHADVMLNNRKATLPPQCVGGNMVPTLKIRDFTCTSLSDAV